MNKLSDKTDHSHLPIILVDDEPNSLKAMEITLRSAGFSNVITALNGKDILNIIQNKGCDLVVLDIMMPDVSGIILLKQIRETVPDVPVIMASGVDEIETAVTCMKEGAHDYILKPLERERFISSVKRALEMRDLLKENRALSSSMLSEQLQHPQFFEAIATGNEKMHSLFRYIEAIAPSEHSVLITGETGVGKELIAKAIHDCSGRNGEFVAVNVAGLEDTVFSDTLFGHMKGAFTGAENVRKGLVESAAQGTLFLDEIGDLSPMSQVKLLRLLQEKEYLPLGSDVAKRSSARVIAATCKNIESLKKSDVFRKDLYYRLKTHHIHLPPLRQRMGDLKVLVESFAAQAAHEAGKSVPVISSDLYNLLGSYSFPGNIRELQSMVSDAISNHQGKVLSLKGFKKAISPDDSFSDEADSTSVDALSSTHSSQLVTFYEKLPTLKECDHLLIKEAMTRAEGKLAVAAAMLGITRQALGQRLRKD